MEKGIEFWSGNPSVDILKGNIALSDTETPILLMVDIPTSLILVDLYVFLSASLPQIKEIRVLKGPTSKHYLCAILTDSDVSAKEIFQAYSGVKFNSIEDHICQLLFVQSIDISGSDSNLFINHSDHCPICLEDIDVPAITVLCGHSFHIKCLEKLNHSTCPVCRYHLSPPDKSQCDTCGEEENVTMCLICGELGCKYHSEEHYETVGHTYFQDIETKTTWDYSRGIPIHRLVSSGDKIVEVASPGEHQSKKAENLVFEYNCLLSSLLETQREYYNERLKELDTTLDSSLIELLRNIQKENRELSEKCRAQESLEKEIESIGKIIKRENERAEELAKENQELAKLEKGRTVFKCTKEVKDEIEDLEGRIKDMQFYVKAQRKLEGEKIDSIEIREKK
ncbi:unnamed protein product [Blepharisma stoltei]|uniref:BRCA1-associated protein n=1 Tax=Blepharisma stoltei TaxID=1481888 RepID=A0AAU9KAJ2_9CILI|nr:unnamed protein product [Blepharisma stoltei]